MVSIFHKIENSVRTILSNSDLEIGVDKVKKRGRTLIVHDSLEVYLDQTSPESINHSITEGCQFGFSWTYYIMKTIWVSILGDTVLFSSKNKSRIFYIMKKSCTRNLMQISNEYTYTIKRTLIICLTMLNKNETNWSSSNCYKNLANVEFFAM